MRPVIDRNFPYPILLEGGGDFKNARFFVETSTCLSSDSNSLFIKFIYKIECPFIQSLVDEGKVVPFVNISQRTYRKSAMLSKEKDVEIPMDWLSPNYNLEIMPMLIAKEDFTFEYDESMDEAFSYFDESFEVKRGQIIGYGNYMQIDLPTSQKIGSIFTISKLKNEEDKKKGYPYLVTLDEQVIDIKVMPDIYEAFFKMKDRDATYRKLLYSVFVYPAVQLAILTLLQDYESVRDLKWCIAITNKISKRKSVNFDSYGSFTKDDIFEFTNIVLDTLLQDAFNDIDNGGEE